MKKVLLCAMALLCAIGASAQESIPELLQVSQERMEKLEKIKKPQPCGVSLLDELIDNVADLTAESVQITPLLQNMYYRSVGQTEDGVTDVTVKKPTLKELLELSERIGAQAQEVVAMVSKIANIKNELKTIVVNPMQMAKAAKTVKYVADVAKILGEESADHVKIIAGMIETAKSEENL